MKRKLGREGLSLAILTLMTVLTWVGFDVYRAAVKTVLKPDTREQLISLNPHLDTEVIEELRSKRGLPSIQVANYSFPETDKETEEVSPTPTPPADGEEEATESAEPAESEEI